MCSKDRSESGKGLDASLVLKDNGRVYFHKSYSIKGTVFRELDKMAEDGFLIPKNQNKIAIPI